MQKDICNKKNNPVGCVLCGATYPFRSVENIPQLSSKVPTSLSVQPYLVLYYAFIKQVLLQYKLLQYQGSRLLIWYG